MKTCRKCQRTLSIESFKRDSSRADGRSSRCLDCTREEGRLYFARHQEEGRARARRWRENNRERHRAYSREWYAKHPEQASEAAHRVYLAKRAVYIKRAMEYKRAHPDLARADARRRSVGRNRAAFDYAQTLLLDLCSYCGGPGGVVDHIVPLSGGGENSADNLTAACVSCNSAKRSSSLIRFMLKLAREPRGIYAKNP